jgi:hypothetical protein
LVVLRHRRVELSLQTRLFGEVLVRRHGSRRASRSSTAAAGSSRSSSR